MSEAYTTAAPPESDPLADLGKALEAMKSLPPMPVAVWFVDRDAEYQQLLRLLPRSENPTDRLAGLPTRQWSLREIEERVKELTEVDGRTEEYCLEVFPFRTAGVWVEMSNGEHQEIEIPHRPGWTPK